MSSRQARQLLVGITLVIAGVWVTMSLSLSGGDSVPTGHPTASVGRPSGVEVRPRTDPVQEIRPAPTAPRLTDEPKPECMSYEAMNAAMRKCSTDRPIVIWMAGDSHGRGLTDHMYRSFGVSPHPKSYRIPLSPSNFTVVSDFIGTMAKLNLEYPLSELQEAARTSELHYQMSRGAWDLLVRDTRPNQIYNELIELFSQLSVVFPNASVAPKSVSFLFPHRFKEASFFYLRPCITAPRMEAIRRVIACAVTAHNSNAPEWLKISLYDVTPFVDRYPESVKDDGHHMVYNGLIAEGMLSHYICPNIKAPWGHLRRDDAKEINAAFQCEAIHEEARDRGYHVSEGIANAIDHVLDWKPMSTCACSHEPVTDACVIGKKLNDVLTGWNMVKTHPARLLMDYLCDLRVAAKGPRWYVPSQIPVKLVHDDEFIKAVVEAMLLNATLFPACVRNLGYRPIGLKPDEMTRLFSADSSEVCRNPRPKIFAANLTEVCTDSAGATVTKLSGG